MKNSFFVLMLFIGALSMTVTSCNEDILPDNGEGNEGNGVRTVKIGVQIESGTKVTLSNEQFSWVEGDVIAVWTGTSNTSGSFQSCSVSSKSITVSLNEGESLRNYAIYPASVKDDSNYGQSTLNVKLPASYAYNDISGNNTPLPMVATNTEGNLEFYNVGGLLRLTVSGIPEDATGLYIQFPGRKVNGTFPVSDPGTNTSTISTGVPGSGEDKITVNFDAGTATEMTLNIPLPTGIYEDVLIMPVGSSTKSVAFQSIISDDTYEVKRAHGKKLTAPIMTGGFDLKNDSFNNSEVSYAYIYQSNAAATSTPNTITIADGQKVLLDGVNIKAENANAINCLGSAEIVLSGTNTVTSESNPATSGTLNFAVIKAGTYEPIKTTLTISGDGILNANPVYYSGATNPAHNGAVIGADFEGSCGNIVINGGTITVSTNYGAAIGSGRVGSGTSKCGSITINGGTIKATGSTGAGIGSGGRTSGNSGKTSCDGITIKGGKVTARSVGGAAIGAGKCEGGGTNSNSYCGDILITGGTIDAQTTNTGDYAGAAIGGGYHSKAGNITISGGIIKAYGHRYSAGIGAGGRNSQCGNILINGGSVDTQGGYGTYEGAGIGTGKGSANNAKSTCGTITITNGVTVVKAYNSYGSASKMNIGKGSSSYTQCGAVTIPGVSGTGGVAGGSQFVYQPGAGS